MKNINKLRIAMILTIALVGLSQTSLATTYTASANGNWSAAATWGGTAPGANITSADAIVIPLGTTVTLDENVTVNNALATVTVTGTLSGTSGLTVTAGTLSGAGSVVLQSITIGTAGLITSTGSISANAFTNNQLLLSLVATVNVGTSVNLNAGVIQLNSGSSVNLADNITLNMAGGSLSINGGSISLAGSYNLVYSGASISIGLEATQAGLQNVTINLPSASTQISMTSDLTVGGALSLQSGTLVLNNHNLTLNGTVSTSAGSSIYTSSSSIVTINGSGNVGTIAFTPGWNTVGGLTVNIGSSGSVSLGSDVMVSGVLTLAGGNLNLNSNNLTIGGTVSSTGGSIYTSSSSDITINGSGSIGTIAFTPGWNTVGGLTVNLGGSSASVSLGSDLAVSGALILSGGSLAINGNNLTLSGSLSTTGTGSISGSSSSNLTLSGSGSMGSLSFTAGGNSSTLNNLTVNIGSSGSASFGSDLTVDGTLALTSGIINTGSNNLIIGGSGTVQGGSSASYVVSTDVGRMTMIIANAGASAMFQVGTMANYAPVTVTNNSSSSGTFSVNAHSGVFTAGTTGTDISATQSVVNTSWNVESSITSGANVNLDMNWNTSMQVNGFDNTQAYVSHYTNGGWNTSALTAATANGGGTFSLALTGVTSFSPFAVFDKNTNVNTGITDITADNTLGIYPNPAGSIVHIGVPNPSADYTVAVYNMSGQLMFEREATSNSLDVSSLSVGLYNVAINQQGNTLRGKVAIIK